jgi:hypothetical protein
MREYIGDGSDDGYFERSAKTCSQGPSQLGTRLCDAVDRTMDRRASFFTVDGSAMEKDSLLFGVRWPGTRNRDSKQPWGSIVVSGQKQFFRATVFYWIVSIMIALWLVGWFLQ